MSEQFKSDTMREFVEDGDDAQEVLNKADTVVLTYMARIERQKDSIDRLLDGDGSAEIIMQKEDEIQAMDIQRTHAVKDLASIRALCKARGWDLGRLG